MKRCTQAIWLGLNLYLLMSLACTTLFSSQNLAIQEAWALSQWALAAILLGSLRTHRKLPGYVSLAALSGAILILGLLLPDRCCRLYSPLSGCRANLTNLVTALELYAADHRGGYPESLQSLVPRYVRAIPDCPGARKDTYSRGFQLSQQSLTYTLMCRGCHHHRSGLHHPNFPQYSSEQGFILGPTEPER